ncbi:hypothetical protein QWZ06_19250 [Chryseobacterium tructae]|uniref:Uncharacterized protein n=1 Tax=Chryseobacterium tructae TaxID=1037380 RepID=A0ABV7Y2G0_9FLAO|nr:hypothetical protein [Chryseobacterium tructae]MDN3694262.1 hypothetical protein [Chryseobacterium tructae]
MKKCRLCNIEQILIKKSHIYPDFLYKDLYDKNHKIIKISTEEIIKKNPKISRPSSGVYEGGLLCSDCENRIIGGKYESYLADILSSKNRDVKCNKGKSAEIKTLTVQNLDYERFKNFFLSILFRADICTFEEFEDINLGPYNDKIRKIVYENQTTDDLEFQLNILKFDKNSEFDQLIVQPFKSKLETETCYSFLLRGFFIIINFKENNTSKKMKGNRLKQNGEIIIPIIPRSTEKKFILTYLDLK